MTGFSGFRVNHTQHQVEAHITQMPTSQLLTEDLQTFFLLAFNTTQATKLTCLLIQKNVLSVAELCILLLHLKRFESIIRDLKARLKICQLLSNRYELLQKGEEKPSYW